MSEATAQSTTAQSTQSAKVSSAMTGQQVLSFINEKGLANNFGVYHYSFGTSGLFATGPVVVSEFDTEGNGENRIYRGRQLKFWATLFGYIPGETVDYRTGKATGVPASFEVFVDVDKADLIKQGMNLQGFVISARNGLVPAYDYIIRSDAEMMLQALGKSFNELPTLKQCAVEKDDPGLSRDDARKARRLRDDISFGNDHYIDARGTTEAATNVTALKGLRAETRTAEATAVEAEAKAHVAVEQAGSKFAARLRSRR